MLPGPDFRAKFHLISTKLVLGGFSRDGVVGVGGGSGSDGGGDDGGGDGRGDGSSVDVVVLEVSIW